MAGHVKRQVSRRTGTVSWQARLPHPARPGQRLVRTFERKSEAQRWLQREHAKLLTGDFIDPRAASTPFAELVATWERTRVAKLAPKTRERYASVTKKYLLPQFGSTPVGRLTRADIKEWFAGLTLTAGTARKVQVVLSSVLSEGVELGLLRENPALRLRLATPPRRDMTILTAEEVRTVAQAMPRPTDRLAVYVAAYTGLRAGGQWALRRRDIDLRGRRLAVVRTLKDSRGRLEFVNATKTEGSRRVVSLPAFLINMLRVHLDTLPADPDTLVFSSPGGMPTRHNEFIKRAFAPAVRGTRATRRKPERVSACQRASGRCAGTTSAIRVRPC